MEPMCRDRFALARRMKELGLTVEGTTRLFALKNCATTSDCQDRATCHQFLEAIWTTDCPQHLTEKR